MKKIILLVSILASSHVFAQDAILKLTQTNKGDINIILDGIKICHVSFIQIQQYKTNVTVPLSCNDYNLKITRTQNAAYTVAIYEKNKTELLDSENITIQLIAKTTSKESNPRTEDDSWKNNYSEGFINGYKYVQIWDKF